MSVGLPSGRRALEARIRQYAGEVDEPETRLTLAVASTVVAQMLPAGVVKGGAAMQLRLGYGTSRLSQDLDAARAGALEEFETTFRTNLSRVWLRKPYAAKQIGDVGGRTGGTPSDRVDEAIHWTNDFISKIDKQPRPSR